jgi:hypothetical protein
VDSLGHADARQVAPRFGALRKIGWRMTVGLGAAALAGFVIGPGVGRLFMFVLRPTSPDPRAHSTWGIVALGFLGPRRFSAPSSRRSP